MLTHSLDYEAEQMGSLGANQPTNQPVSLGHAFSGINCWALVLLGALLLPRAPKPRPHQRRVPWALGLGLVYGEASAGCVFQEFHAKVPMSRSSGRGRMFERTWRRRTIAAPPLVRAWCRRCETSCTSVGEAGHRELPSPSARATGPAVLRAGGGEFGSASGIVRMGVPSPDGGCSCSALYFRGRRGRRSSRLLALLP